MSRMKRRQEESNGSKKTKKIKNNNLIANSPTPMHVDDAAISRHGTNRLNEEEAPEIKIKEHAQGLELLLEALERPVPSRSVADVADWVEVFQRWKEANPHEKFPQARDKFTDPVRGVVNLGQWVFRCKVNARKGVEKYLLVMQRLTAIAGEDTPDWWKATDMKSTALDIEDWVEVFSRWKEATPHKTFPSGTGDKFTDPVYGDVHLGSWVDRCKHFANKGVEKYLRVMQRLTAIAGEDNPNWWRKSLDMDIEDWVQVFERWKKANPNRTVPRYREKFTDLNLGSWFFRCKHFANKGVEKYLRVMQRLTAIAGEDTPTR